MFLGVFQVMLCFPFGNHLVINVCFQVSEIANSVFFFSDL